MMISVTELDKESVFEPVLARGVVTKGRRELAMEHGWWNGRIIVECRKGWHACTPFEVPEVADALRGSYIKIDWAIAGPSIHGPIELGVSGFGRMRLRRYTDDTLTTAVEKCSAWDPRHPSTFESVLLKPWQPCTIEVFVPHVGLRRAIEAAATEIRNRRRSFRPCHVFRVDETGAVVTACEHTDNFSSRSYVIPQSRAWQHRIKNARVAGNHGAFAIRFADTMLTLLGDPDSPDGLVQVRANTEYVSFIRGDRHVTLQNALESIKEVDDEPDAE